MPCITPQILSMRFRHRVKSVSGTPSTSLGERPAHASSAFGSQCFIHIDSEHHRVASEPNDKAAACNYMCRANHICAPGHVVWDYHHRRRLIVLSIRHVQWNHYPLRLQGSCHLSSRLTWVSPPVEHTQPTQTEQQPLSPPSSTSRQAESSEETPSPSILHIDDIDAADLPIATNT
jgi:hypothetical protein